MTSCHRNQWGFVCLASSLHVHLIETGLHPESRHECQIDSVHTKGAEFTTPQVKRLTKAVTPNFLWDNKSLDSHHTKPVTSVRVTI